VSRDGLLCNELIWPLLGAANGGKDRSVRTEEPRIGHQSAERCYEFGRASAVP
jgi:hypothetical protein